MKKKRSYDSASRIRGMQLRSRWSALDKALDEAAKGSTDALVRYLRDGVAISEQRHLDAIADLVKRRGVGHPVDLSPRVETMRLIIGMVRNQERLWRRRHPGKSLPRGLRIKLIEQAMAFIGEEGRLAIQNISVEESGQETGGHADQSRVGSGAIQYARRHRAWRHHDQRPSRDLAGQITRFPRLDIASLLPCNRFGPVWGGDAPPRDDGLAKNR